MEQTAVEWLIKEFRKNRIVIPMQIEQQAKKMEKQQKKECWDVAHQAGRFEGKGIAEENWQTFQQYYNETFGGKDE